MRRPVTLLLPVSVNYCVISDEIEELALVRGVLSSHQLLKFGTGL